MQSTMVQNAHPFLEENGGHCGGFGEGLSYCLNFKLLRTSMVGGVSEPWCPSSDVEIFYIS